MAHRHTGPVPPTACPVSPDALTLFGAGAEAAWGFYYRTQGVHAPPELMTSGDLREFAAGWQAAWQEVARRQDGNGLGERRERIE